MKRILTVQDISGVGKCSATVALPVISAMGVECAVMPTAVLSTHTMFQGFTFCDLTAELPAMAKHWKEQALSFDAIYTGYLGSFDQLAVVERLFDDFRTEGNLMVVDPVMGDNGKLYPGFSEEFALAMGKLCGKADLIVPNLTEACFMLGIPYLTSYTKEQICDLLRRLAALGAPQVALTGIAFTEDKTGVAYYNASADSFYFYEHERMAQSFHGTGDLFASTTVGGLMRGLSATEALTLAADYTALTIKTTMEDPDHVDYGVSFELTVPALVSELAKKVK